MDYFFVITVAVPLANGEQRATFYGIFRVAPEDSVMDLFMKVREYAEEQIGRDNLNVLFYRCEPNRPAASDVTNAA